jgi:CRISPR system Cascade subunit CasD
MPEYLILKLQGAMQAYGGHTYEVFRPSMIFPTRSAIVGLLGACLGISREHPEILKQLNDSFELTVLAHSRTIEHRHFSDSKQARLKKDPLNLQKIIDYHTVLDARRSTGQARPDAIVSQREYLCDAEFTLALNSTMTAKYGLKQLELAVKKPIYTPYLGRRSCPLQRPLYENKIKADSVQQALNQYPNGTLYSEIKLDNSYAMQIRDLPLFKNKRQFITRTVYVVGG